MGGRGAGGGGGVTTSARSHKRYLDPRQTILQGHFASHFQLHRHDDETRPTGTQGKEEQERLP
jgi:hypothetical protein